MARFAGKTVLVTGAASGIGRATAALFSSEGANVVALDLKQEDLEAALADLPPDRTLLREADTSRPEDAASAVKTAAFRFDGLHVLVNNAGVAFSGTLEETPEEEWRRVMSTNVDGYYHMARAAIPELKKSRGSIVMTSSVSGLGGDWNMAAYNTSKGAVTNMVRALAMDLGKSGVRVNAVNPSFTRTGMTADMVEDEALVASFKQRIPMKRIGEPEDVAKVIAFLASDDAGFVSGVNLPVDGGLSASNGQPPQ